MFHALSNVVIGLVESYGLIAVLVLMTLESCGIPAPSEVIMVFAGVLAGTGHLALIPAILAGTAGNVLGSVAAYYLAMRFGRPLLLGPGRYVGISTAHVDLAQRWFDRHGLLAVLLGRVLPVIRTYISFPAGLARVRFVPFVVLTAIGALPWCALLAVIGFAVGSNYERVLRPFSAATIVIAVLIAAALGHWLWRGRQSRAIGPEP